MTVTVGQPGAPTAAAASATTSYNTAASINLASAIAGVDITAVNIAGSPSHGTVSVLGETVTYTPSSTFYGGTDSFTYTATNPSGTSTPATVTVTVGQAAIPTVAAASATTPYGTATSINLTSAITGVDIAAVNIASSPSHGTVSVSGETVTYMPSSTFYGGTDSFTYTAINPSGHSAPATITVTVTPMNVPIAPPLYVATSKGTNVLIDASAEANGTQPLTGTRVATQPTHGTATASGEQILYTPAAGFVGTDTFSYQLSNHFWCVDTGHGYRDGDRDRQCCGPESNRHGAVGQPHIGKPRQRCARHLCVVGVAWVVAGQRRQRNRESTRHADLHAHLDVPWSGTDHHGTDRIQRTVAD